MPRLILNSWRIVSAEAKFRVYYAGTHKKVVDDVLSGKAEVGGCGCSEIDSARKSPEFDEKAVVVCSYDNIPLGPVVYKQNLNPKSARVILDLLLRVHEERPDLFVNFCNGWTEFRQAKRFKEISDKEFDNFRLLFGDNEELWKLIQ
jgi:ABC-type phosphate/phosphonate transport system substrate-binding protein